ncbi:MAG: glycoside hydrolase family 71/99-like protein [Opitutaceae bacterium]|nr:glycoside hydrolase family 71/99-like protein [Opitutaceae bacterium]
MIRRTLIFSSVVLVAFIAACVSPTTRRVDSSTLRGKVMCGYQGWFNGEGDGANRGYNHWARGGARPGPGRVTVDLWPDLTELAPNERFATDFVHADGRPAEVFSSFVRPTVLRHFQWMREHGIDGVFIQRFINSLGRPASLTHNNTVLEHCREGARLHGRTYALMYDLSSLAPGHADRLIDDWKTLARETRFTRDANYLKHRGKPLLALWGCGFKDNDKPRPSLDDWRKILTFLKNDPESGQLALMIGVPSFWREQTRDCIADPALHELLQMADVISPWTPGRYRTPEAAAKHATDVWQPDVAWCNERRIDYLPVAYPGFSWHNLKGDPLDAIPRLQGRFLWSQVTAAKRIGADMLYVAMFDEVDEGTAIFKCTNNPPAGPGVSFLTYEGLPSDHYLRLTGLAGKVIRGELPPTDAIPAAAQPQRGMNGVSAATP